ncbi:hypothetical protein AB0B94_30665 [Micromonospora sp. NPDC048986]|uniref:hypothetical protein n=1 Tax=Micromonospora sp. NPDC048986 TaxID=3155644 RepID=UPI0033CAF78C
MQWPLLDASGAQGTADISTSNGFVTVTASATPHTPGPWVEMVTSTGRDYAEITLILLESIATSATNTSTLVDIGIGASGSETPLVSSIGIGHSGAGKTIRIPIIVPAGSRITTRLRSIVVSKAAELAVILGGGSGWNPPEAGSVAVTYGADTATSAGTNLTLPPGNHIKGAWTQITASTTAPIRWLVPLLVGNSTDVAWAANHRGLLDIGVGGSGAEAVIIPNLGYGAFNNEALLYYPVTVPVSIPSGTRLVARYQAALVSEGPGVILVGVG